LKRSPPNFKKRRPGTLSTIPGKKLRAREGAKRALTSTRQSQKDWDRVESGGQPKTKAVGERPFERKPGENGDEEMVDPRQLGIS